MARQCSFQGQPILLAALCAVLLGWAGLPVMQSANAATDLEWAWPKGPATVNTPGIYGTILVSALGNNPGGREGAASWTDLSGGLWLLGGHGYTASGSWGNMNDLWKYNRSTRMWTWMKGSSEASAPGVYGTILTPGTANTPGAREYASTWVDSSGALWLFGGWGYDMQDSIGYLNDLWRYDLSSGNWTWVKGSSLGNPTGTYGTPLVAAPTNTPGGRISAVTWIDSSGALWLFGGEGYGASGSSGVLNDLWRFEPTNLSWTWMKGASTINVSGSYGTILVSASGNNPGGREWANSWTDPSGAFWLFGGYGYNAAGSTVQCNDLWKYQRSTGEWTWMKGSSLGNESGNYGLIATPASGNRPGGRHGAVSWSDPSGGLWLGTGYGIDSAGGYGYLNDLWRYDRSSGNWTWLKGGSLMNELAVYGTLATPAPTNHPGACYGAVSWVDSSSTLWLWGGIGYNNVGSTGSLCDMWNCADMAPPTGTVMINDNRSVTNNTNVTLSLTWNDDIGSGAVRMKFSNDGTTWTSWESLAATKAWAIPSGDGYKTVRTMFRDRAGNNSIVYSDYIRLDTVPPTGSIVINGGASSTKSRVVSLGLTWDDGAGSGVSKMRFSIDGATWSSWEAPFSPKSYTLPAPLGYYTVRVQFLDAGNNHSTVYSDYIKLIAP